MPLLTVGHGNRTSEELTSILVGGGVTVVADVRRFPASRRNPHLNREALQAELAARQIEYQWWGATLGGRRRPGAGRGRHRAWRQPAFRGYAEYMDTVEFRTALARLLELAEHAPTAIMCAETLWWRCHRRLISDAATLAGTPVVHLVGLDRSQPHRLDPAVRSGADGWPVYDVGVQQPLI